MGEDPLDDRLDVEVDVQVQSTAEALGWVELLVPWRAIPPATLALAVLLTPGSYAARALRLYDYFIPPTRGGSSGYFKLTPAA